MNMNKLVVVVNTMLYLILMATSTRIKDSEGLLNHFVGQNINYLDISPQLLSSVIAQMGYSTGGALSCAILLVDKIPEYNGSSYVMIETTNNSNKNKMLPLIRFNLNLKPDSININKISLSTRSCPNYIIISINKENIAKFLDSFKTALRRKHSHYVLFVPRNFSTDEFFEDISYFRKVAKMAVIVMDTDYSRNSPANQLSSDIPKRDNALVYIRDEVNINNLRLVENWNGKSILGNIFPKDTLSNLFGRELRGSSFDHKPYTYVADTVNGEYIYEGTEFKMMDTIADSMNFSFTITRPSDGTTFGEEIEPGVFTGVFGELQQDNADIIWADLWVKLNRYKHFDFTYPYRIEHVCFMVKRPPPLVNWMSPVMPFKKEVWIILTVTVFATNLLPYILRYWGTSRNNILISLFDIIIKFWTNMCLVVLPLMFFLTKLLYKGNLISQLTVETSIEPINTLKELAFENDDVPVGCFTNYLQKYVKTSTNPYILKISETFKAYYDYEKAFQEAFNGRLVMGESREFAEYNIRTRFTDKYGKRSMHIMKECIKPIGVAFVLQKDSLLTNQVNRKITQLVESGLTDKWMLDEFEKVAKKLSEKTSIKFEILRLDHLQGLFFFWVLLLLSSILVFLVELVWYMVITKIRKWESIREDTKNSGMSQIGVNSKKHVYIREIYTELS